MKNKIEGNRPKYATLLYEVREKLDISWTEYVYLDMVYHLSHDTWCYKSLENIGRDLGLDRSNVFRMRKRLMEKDLIKKNVRGHVKTTVTYANCIQLVNPRMQFATEPYAKRDYSVVKTQPKNNNRTTEESDSNNLGGRGEYSPAKERLRAMLKRKELSRG